MPWTDPTDAQPARHARVWLDPDAWRADLVGDVPDDALGALDAWIAAGRPVVARRRDAGVTAVCLGVVLQSPGVRRRVGFAVGPRAVVRVAPPLRLAEAIDAAPHAWRSPLAGLVDHGGRLGIDFRVYGSLAWQAVSGERYVGPASDVDLLWSVAAVERVDAVLRMLTDWESATGLRADGELRLPDGDGIAWRELLARPDRVLVKHRHGVSLQTTATWTGQYVPAALESGS